MLVFGSVAHPASPQVQAVAVPPPQPQRQPQPQAADEDIGRVASEIHEAVKGGVFGWGTDEDALWRALEGKDGVAKTQDTWNRIRSAYKQHHGSDLDHDVIDDIEDQDEKLRAKALLRGTDDPASAADAAAAKIEHDVRNGGDVLGTLRDTQPQERQSIRSAYKRLYRKDLLERLGQHGEAGLMKAQEVEEARALFNPFAPGADMTLARSAARRAHDTLDFGYAWNDWDGQEIDIGAFENSLKGFDGAGQMKLLKQAYYELYGKDMAADVRTAASDDTQRDRALLLMGEALPGQKPMSAEDRQAKLNALELRSLGDDSDKLREKLESLGPQAVASAQKADTSLAKDVLSAIDDGHERAEIAMLLNDPRQNPPAQDAPAEDQQAWLSKMQSWQADYDARRVNRALDGLNDEDLLRSIFQGADGAHIDRVLAAHKRLFGGDLRERLVGELGGRDEHQIVEVLIDRRHKIATRAPQTREEWKALLTEEVERLGLLEQHEGSSSFSGFMQKLGHADFDYRTDSERLDASIHDAREALKRDDLETAARLVGLGKGDVKALVATKNSASEGAATAVAVVASGATIALTGGTATPLVAGAWAVAAGAASAGTTYYLTNGQAGGMELARQTAIGGVSAIPFGGRAITTAAQQAGGRIMTSQVLKATASAGAQSGAISGGTMAATDQHTWEHGVGQGALHTVFSAGTGAAAGTLLAPAGHATIAGVRLAFTRGPSTAPVAAVEEPPAVPASAHADEGAQVPETPAKQSGGAAAAETVSANAGTTADTTPTTATTTTTSTSSSNPQPSGDKRTQPTPAHSYPKLFSHVQLHGRGQGEVGPAYRDSKTFVDALPREHHTPEMINTAFDKLLTRTGHAPTPAQLKGFVEEHFTLPKVGGGDGTAPAAGTAAPASIDDHIEQMWEVLRRPANPSPRAGSSELPMKAEVIVPADRFGEAYNWDMLPTIKGVLAESKRLQREAWLLEREARSAGRDRKGPSDEARALRAEASRKHELARDRQRLVRGIVQNFADAIDQYGFVPNGFRSYYLQRAQPEVFAEMVSVTARELNDPGLVGHYLPQMRKVHAFWMNTGRGTELQPGQATLRVVKTPDGKLLNRYHGGLEGTKFAPREESFFEDIETAAMGLAARTGRDEHQMVRLLSDIYTRHPGHVGIEDIMADDAALARRAAQETGLEPEEFGRFVNDKFQNMHAGAESGWDYSAMRWAADGQSLHELQVTQLAPADLNSFLYTLETTIARAYREQGDLPQAWHFEQVARDRAQAMRTHLWNPKTRRFEDYNFETGQTTGVATAAMVMPVRAGVATPEQAQGVARNIKGHWWRPWRQDGLLQRGGLATTLDSRGRPFRAEQQWDGENGWAPNNMYAAEAVYEGSSTATRWRRGGQERLARRIGNHFEGTVRTVYDDTAEIWEKYDVVRRAKGGGGEYEMPSGFGWTNGFTAWWREQVRTGWAQPTHGGRNTLVALLKDPRAPLVPIGTFWGAFIGRTNTAIHYTLPYDPHAVLPRVMWDAVIERKLGKLQFQVDRATMAATSDAERQARREALDELEQWLQRKGPRWGMTEEGRYRQLIAIQHLRLNPHAPEAIATLDELPGQLMRRGTWQESTRNAISGTTLGPNLGNGIVVSSARGAGELNPARVTPMLWNQVNAVYSAAEVFAALGTQFKGRAGRLWHHIVASPRLAIAAAFGGPQLTADLSQGRLGAAAFDLVAAGASALEYRRQWRIGAGQRAKRSLTPPLMIMGGAVSGRLLIDILKLDPARERPAELTLASALVRQPPKEAPKKEPPPGKEEPRPPQPKDRNIYVVVDRSKPDTVMLQRIADAALRDGRLLDQGQRSAAQDRGGREEMRREALRQLVQISRGKEVEFDIGLLGNGITVVPKGQPRDPDLVRPGWRIYVGERRI